MKNHPDTFSVLAAAGCASPTEAFGYDADGNLETDGALRYLWNAENRLIEVVTKRAGEPQSGDKRLQFAYDYMGRRVKKTYSTHNGSQWNQQSCERFVYDGWNVVLVLNGSETTQRKYTWGLDLSGTLSGAGGIGGLLAVEETAVQDSPAYWYLYDGNGNVTQVLAATNQATVAHYEYDPYGTRLASTGTYANDNPFRFSTKCSDDEFTSQELYYYGYRYYAPRLGRWLNRDPIGEEGGDNLYAALGNTATNAIDPDGQVIIALGGSGGVIGESEMKRLAKMMREREQAIYRSLRPCVEEGWKDGIFYSSNPTINMLNPDWDAAVDALTHSLDAYLSVYWWNKARKCCPEPVHIIGFSDGASTIAKWIERDTPTGPSYVPKDKRFKLGGVGLIAALDLVRFRSDSPEIRFGPENNSSRPPQLRGISSSIGVEHVAFRNRDLILAWAGHEIVGWTNYYVGINLHGAIPAHPEVVQRTLSHLESSIKTWLANNPCSCD